MPGIVAKGPWQVVASENGEPIIKGARGYQNYWPALTANGRMLMTLKEEILRVFDLETRKERTFEKATPSWEYAAISTNGRILVVPDWVERQNSYQPLIRLVDLASGKELRSAANLGIAHCCFSPDGNCLAVCGGGGINIWHTATGTLMASFDGHRAQ